MTFTIIKVEQERFRGKLPPVQILTLSCSHAEFLHASRSQAHNSKGIQVRILQEEPLEILAAIALVHPVSAPAMLTIPTAIAFQVGAQLALVQPGA